MSERKFLPNGEEIIRKIQTTNRDVSFGLGKWEDVYVVYMETYEGRVDFVISFTDKDEANRMCQFLVDAYEEGYTDGKNQALMYMGM